MSWQMLKLSDVCDVRRGTTITEKQAIVGDIPVVAGGLSYSYKHNAANRTGKVITVSGSGANAGYVNFWQEPIFASDCSTVQPKSDCVDIKFVYYFLKSKQQFINSTLRSGAAQPHVYAKDIAQISIPLPPLAEQKRIAEILDKAAAIKAKREQAIVKLDELAHSMFVEMFGDVKSTNKWNRMKISSVSNVYTGKTPPTSNKENYADEVPFVTPTDLRGLITSPARYVSKKGASLIKTVRKGSCLVGCIGDVGRVGYVNMPVTFNQQINAVEWNTDLVDDIFGYFLLKYMEEVLKKTAVSAVVPILNKTNFSNISIPIPPISEQRKFSEFVCNIWKIENTMKNEVGKNLLNSLQHQAFTTGFNA